MAMQWSSQMCDIVIFDRHGQPVALVEVKSRRDLSEAAAREVASYVLEMASGAPPSVRYFLVLTPTRGYLWHVHKEPPRLRAPVSFPMEEVVQRYGGLRQTPGLVHASLAYLVDRWLSDLALGRDGLSQGVLALLRESGFVDAIAGGEIQLEVTV